MSRGVINASVEDRVFEQVGIELGIVEKDAQKIKLDLPELQADVATILEEIGALCTVEAWGLMRTPVSKKWTLSIRFSGNIRFSKIEEIGRQTISKRCTVLSRLVAVPNVR